MTTEQIKEQLAFWQNEWKKDLTDNIPYLNKVSDNIDRYLRIEKQQKSDNEMMRKIRHKLFMRGNVRLTDEEKTCLKRHGVKREGGKLFVGNFEISNVRSIRGDLSKVNFADRADKAAERQFSHMVNGNYCGDSFQEKFKWWLHSNNYRQHNSIVRACREKRHYERMMSQLATELEEDIRKLIEQNEMRRESYQRFLNWANRDIAELKGRFNR